MGPFESSLIRIEMTNSIGNKTNKALKDKTKSKNLLKNG